LPEPVSPNLFVCWSLLAVYMLDFPVYLELENRANCEMSEGCLDLVASLAKISLQSPSAAVVAVYDAAFSTCPKPPIPWYFPMCVMCSG
jgi:hypothetical protein